MKKKLFKVFLLFLPVFFIACLDVSFDFSDYTTDDDHEIRGVKIGTSGQLAGGKCNLDWCEDDLWFMGHLHRIGKCGIWPLQYDCNATEIPDSFGGRITGADLGISVTLDGLTYVYMGDILGTQMLANCNNPDCVCDEAIAIIDIDDNDPSDGVDAQIVTGDRNGINRYYPITMPGVHFQVPDNATTPTFGPFNVPTGAAVSNETHFFYDGDLIYENFSRIWLFYGTKIKDNSLRRSYFQCSWDGVTFGPADSDLRSDLLYEPELITKPLWENDLVTLSTDKFISVSPVPIPAGFQQSLCEENAADFGDSTFCGLKERVLQGLEDVYDVVYDSYFEGMLLFGSGEYRNGDLYLAFIHYATSRVWYYSNGDWVYKDESQATPIISGDNAVDKFGELSVKLIGDGTHLPYFVMLSQHNFDVYYRAAAFDNPEDWTAPQKTTAKGYGPYIIDKYMEVENSKLKLYHTISSWDGEKNNLDKIVYLYGVFTRPLILDSTKDAPVWPPQGLPVWP